MSLHRYVYRRLVTGVACEVFIEVIIIEKYFFRKYTIVLKRFKNAEALIIKESLYV